MPRACAPWLLTDGPAGLRILRSPRRTRHQRVLCPPRPPGAGDLSLTRPRHRRYHHPLNRLARAGVKECGAWDPRGGGGWSLPAAPGPCARVLPDKESVPGANGIQHSKRGPGTPRYDAPPGHRFSGDAARRPLGGRRVTDPAGPSAAPAAASNAGRVGRRSPTPAAARRRERAAGRAAGRASPVETWVRIPWPTPTSTR